MANETVTTVTTIGDSETTTAAVERTRVPFGEEDSTIFPGLTKAEEVIVWAGITVAILGVSAILLRLIMPLVRKRCRKNKEDKSMKNAYLRGSSGHLIDSSTPSSASRASTLSRGSNLDDLKARYSDDATSVTTISGSQDSTKASLYGHLSSNHLSVPLYLPRVKSTGSITSATASSSPSPMHKSVTSQALTHKATSAQDQLNTELTRVLSTPQLERLKSLNLSDSYRSNWDKTFSPEKPQPDSWSHQGHPSERRATPQESPRVHRPHPKSSPRSPPELKTRF